MSLLIFRVWRARDAAVGASYLGRTDEWEMVAVLGPAAAFELLGESTRLLKLAFRGSRAGVPALLPEELVLGCSLE